MVTNIKNSIQDCTAIYEYKSQNMNVPGEKINIIYSLPMKNDRNIYLSTNLKGLIEGKNLSLHLVSSKTSINKSTLHNYINGVIPQGLVALLKLSDFFEIPLEELILTNILKRKDNNKSQLSAQGEERYEIIIKKIT